MSASPVTLTHDEDARVPVARPGWCYGTPGVVASMTQVESTLDLHPESYDKALTQISVESLEWQGVISAGLCHGVAGIIT
ncbi:lanthionine synthetase LanC family protein, partial [Klebsiella pneumoniae]